ncbi:ammonia-dependent NAD(+) synthetase [Metabacillus sp. GX 13764]|uniref:ammonia-dependent NAD(+) synthetase n=1 Tax=Metabacillus kandeliae TaxID=2900151 RepID=UPI001E5E0B7F|nr:ammonia-dependent NAD(+) synthetase [Metabacillus kandeliae]
MSMQERIIKALDVQPQIEPAQEIRKRVDFLKQYIKKTKAKGFVLGISLGQDSTLAGKLCQMAVNELREEGTDASFVAVRLPYKVQKDEHDAKLVFDFIEPDKVVTFNIADTVDSFTKTYNEMNDEDLEDYHRGNVKARVRMIVQYAVGGQHGLLVAGTDHAAEAVTGFYTKYGDGGADLLPLHGLSKRQGKALLKELGCPESLYQKAPTADLLDDKPQQADETELGITYDELDDYLEGKEVTKEAAEKIEQRFIVSEHKRQMPATMFDSWWKE